MIGKMFSQLRLVVLIILFYSFPQIVFSQNSILYNFNTSNQLTNLFNGVGPGLSSVTQQAAGGLGNSGSIAVPLNSSVDAVYTTKDGYSLGPIGSSYVFESFIKSEGNGGYSGVGFTTTSPTTASSVTVYRPNVVLGISVHGGGFVFHNNGTNYDGNWNQSSSGSITSIRSSTTCTDLINSTSTTCGSPDRWYKLVFKVTRANTSVFDMRVEIWPANVDGTLRYSTATAIFEVNGVTNTSIASAAQLFSYFNFSGTRVTRFDNYSVNLAGGSTVVQAGFPVVLTPSLSTNSGVVTVNGNVTSANGGTVTERGIVYGTTSNPTVSNNKIVSGSGTGTFSGVTPTLTPGTYYFRAYATNSAGTSYGSELTTTICSQTLPNVTFKLSPPDVTTSSVQGQAGSRTESFNGFSLGNLASTGTFGVGAFTKANTGNAVVTANDVWGGSGSQYLSIINSGSVSINLTDPSRYVGFWWGAGNANNNVTIYGTCGGNEIQLATFTAQNVINLLAGSTVNAVDGNNYNTSLYKRSNAANEPFAYINLELDDPTIYFTRIVFGGSGFEFDNITTSVGYGAASSTTPGAPTITSITRGSGTATINFTAPSSDGGQAITNYQYSIDGGTNWLTLSPADITTPLVISGLNDATAYPIRIRAVNSIGGGAQSNSVNATACTPPQVAAVNNRTVCNGSTSEIITFRPPTTAGYQWMTLNSVSANSASGVGQNGITATITHSAGGMQSHSGMYSSTTFPVEYSVPSTGTQIRNDNAGIFTATFSQPVRDPLVAFASVGNPSTPVQVIVSAPFTPIWSNTANAGWNTTYNTSNNSFTGNEGFNIIRVNGLISSVSFNYTVAESYSTIAFGFVDQNTTYSWTNDNTSIGLAASGTGNLPAFTAINNGTTPVTANITVTPTSASGCAGTPQTFTITVNPSPSVTYPNSSYSLPIGQAISPITPTTIGTAFSVSPALPSGLSLNTSNGAITGTPTLLVNATTYTITSTAAGCSATSTLTIAVIDPTCNTFAAGDFQTNNNATYANNIYTLTPNSFAQNGSAWNKKRLFLDQNFDISARVYLGNSDAGADGIAFVLQNRSLNAGSSGGGLGYEGIAPSFAVEFDTYNNGSHEPVQDHLAIIGNGNASGVHNTYSTPFEVQMEDGQWHTARFVWNAASKNFQVFYDGTRRHNITVDLKANIFGGAPYVYWGFTGATGGATNLQQVQFDSYCYVQQVGVTALAGTNNSNAALAFCEGATVRLQASASTSYQWFRNGTAINGETGRELVVSTSGAYTVQAVSNQNTTLSEVVNVNVTLLPVITYASNYSFERTRAIANTVPTLSGGTATSFAISPALPAGLSFNTTNGTISGTPSVVSASATYTVTGTTATGCAGTTSFTLQVFNAVIPSALSYAPASQTVRQGTAITNMVPTASGGAVASYSISTALPAGLSINTTTGIISGTLTAQQTGTVVYTITATNTGGSTTATVTLIYNTAPTDVALSSTSVAENAASGTSVAILSATDADAGDTFTYTLVSGTGSTDNANFTISGSTLRTAAVFDFETKSSYTVRVRVTDAGGLTFEKAFTISVTDVNEAPTNISASSSSVAENAASGTSVATLSATDADAGDTFTYTLVSGTGSTDNANFTISGSTLRTAAVFDFETKSSYSVRVRVTDAGGLTFEKVFTIGVTDVNDAPTNINASASSVAENAASGTTVATLSTTDADAGDTFTYTLVNGTGSTDNASFVITGTTLSTAAVFDFETKSSYSVRVRVTDAGGLTFEKVFTIGVTDVNDAPTNINASASSVAENAASGTTVASLSATDADAGDTFTYTLVSGTGDTDNASFAITGTTLSTAAVFDFETKSSYSVRVRVTDAGGLTFEKVFTINVTDVNEAPTALALSNTSVLENAASGTTVGTLAGTDADAGDTHTYTLVTGTGSTDNASFAITGTTLSTAAVFNFEAKNSYAVRVRVTDAGGLSFERAFTISVTDVNEAPTLTAITDRRVYNVSTSQVVNLAGITAGPETTQSTTTTLSTDRPATFSSISVVGTQIQFTLAPGIVTPQDVVVTVRVRDNGGVANGGVDTLVRTFRLGIDPMPVAAASPNLITLGATSQLSATGANAVNYTWVAVGGSGIVGSGANINVRPAGTTTYAVVVTNSFGYQATVPVLLTVIVDYKLVPNNLVTPNGDGVNDRWVIPNIDMYPDNEVMVYDKAGRAVFAKRGYNNEWDGTVNGKKLKEDAYFYVIKFNKDGALPIRGYVSIVR